MEHLLFKLRRIRCLIQHEVAAPRQLCVTWGRFFFGEGKDSVTSSSCCLHETPVWPALALQAAASTLWLRQLFSGTG
jgi:hypothetical protein